MLSCLLLDRRRALHKHLWSLAPLKALPTRLGLIIESSPLWKNSLCPLQFGLFGHWIVAEINRLGVLEGVVAAPGLTPEPLLGERENRDGVNQIVW